MLLRIRTKDGSERLRVPTAADVTTLAALRALVADALGVPLEQQVLTCADPTGRRKGALLSPAEDSQTLATLRIANGDLLFLDYAMERENQAHYVEKDPFATLVKDGELRQQGKAQWTLTNFLDYRSTKEFVLGAPPEPHASMRARCSNREECSTTSRHNCPHRIRADRPARDTDAHELHDPHRLPPEARWLAVWPVGHRRSDPRAWRAGPCYLRAEAGVHLR